MKYSGSGIHGFNYPYIWGLLLQPLMFLAFTDFCGHVNAVTSLDQSCDSHQDLHHFQSPSRTLGRAPIEVTYTH